MNTMIYYSFNIIILAVIVLIVGMIKPKWILLWMEKPGRLPIAMIAVAIFMAGAVLFGEGNKQLQQEKEQLSKHSLQQPAAEIPAKAKASKSAPAQQ